GQAALQLYQKSGDDVRGSWQTQLEAAAETAARAVPGENLISTEALRLLGIPSPKSAHMVDAYGYDYPRRPYWYAWCFECDQEAVRTAMALEALAFSVNQISPLTSLPHGDGPARYEAVLAGLGTRFRGHPNRSELFPSAPGATPAQQRARLEAALRDAPDVWQRYLDLGEFIVHTGGTYESARDILRKYPGFSDPNPHDAVGNSNYAYEAGSIFYWQGRPDIARPFYQIAADLQTGSDASLSSMARLRILRGDFNGAAQVLLERATRYNSAYAYRDYLSLLHALGHNDDAWKGFSQLKASFPTPQVWVAALVGHQMQGLSESEVRQWLMSSEIREAQFHTVRFAQYYAILWNTTDRTPAADFGTFLEQLGAPPLGRLDADGRTVLMPSVEQTGYFQVIRRSPLREGKVAARPPDTPVNSHLAYFGAAYTALLQRDYAGAVERFKAMADYYPIEGYPLAYFAYAAAKSGDTEGLEKYLDRADLSTNFDNLLAKAFFAGSRRNADAAQGFLQAAFRNRPNTEFRPILAEYQYAQACEWLWRDTADARFKEALLDWVRKFQVIQPMQAWAYALQYAYEPPGSARVRALALTRYLDPTSERIRDVSASEIAAADSWFRDHNPFKPQVAAATVEGLTTFNYDIRSAYPSRDSRPKGAAHALEVSVR
ncbi:MAG: hypothetical protein JOZ67_04445, partial [Gammaproteobacteria bacterium]|nr:hypothetical protein [Gammaproteobacteria bacterium]